MEIEVLKSVHSADTSFQLTYTFNTRIVDGYRNRALKGGAGIPKSPGEAAHIKSAVASVSKFSCGKGVFDGKIVWIQRG